MNNIKIQELTDTSNKTVKLLTKRLKRVLDVVFLYDTTIYWIHWSENNEGWMIDIFEDCSKNTTIKELSDIEDYESMLCTGKAKQAVEWALFG